VQFRLNRWTFRTVGAANADA